MLPSKDKFNDDDPLANVAELATLNNWYSALFLYFGNFAGLWTFWIALTVGCYVLAYIILVSLIISSFYHLCQTAGYCFQFLFTQHVRTDHFTATLLLGLYINTIVNVRTTCQLIKTPTILSIAPCISLPVIKITPLLCDDDILDITDLPLVARAPVVYQASVLDVDRCDCGHEMQKHFTRNEIAINDVYDSWSAGSTIAIIVITYLAVEAHLYSYAAFHIVIAACFSLAFVKIALIEEGEPSNFHGRISWPELIISLILTAIGLAAYVTDAYIEYMILHSIWHIFIYIGLGFNLIGLTKSVNGWRPLWKYKTRCC